MCWHQLCGKLIGERTRAPTSSLLTELCLADDAVITASTREDITKATMESLLSVV